MDITKGQIRILRDSYESNKEDLKMLEGNEVDISESFERGYNNALEFVFRILGVVF